MNPTDLLVDQMSVSQGDSPVQGSQPVGSGLGSSILPEFHLNCQLATQVVGSGEGRLQQVEVRSSKSGVMNSGQPWQVESHRSRESYGTTNTELGQKSKYEEGKKMWQEKGGGNLYWELLGEGNRAGKKAEAG